MVVARVYVPDRGDVVRLQFDPQTGHEQSGRRPAVVLSPRAYNSKVGLALFCPITSRPKGYPFEVRLQARTGLDGVILSDQIKSLDWKARSARKIARASRDVMQQVTALVLALVDPE
ncbi:MAG: endoribonuclease MazF [Gemmatimonadota bacterium]|nr:MAG: endoribonuclease MazF [Gemmatimonadota bacterium]